jgi:hypothetical protein
MFNIFGEYAENGIFDKIEKDFITYIILIDRIEGARNHFTLPYL